MRILTTLALVGLMGTMSVQAQDRVDNFGIFDHVSAGVSLGTTGIGFEVAAPVTNYLQARVGYSFMPKFNYKGDININTKNGVFMKEDGSGYYDKAKFEGKLNMGDFSVLVDFYPFKTSTFRITGGAYIGKEKFVSVKTTEPFVNSMYWGVAGPELGVAPNTYTIMTDNEGNVEADVKVNTFKPYIGIGFGRAVPKGRVSVCFDLGVQFWGEPGLYTTIDDKYGTRYRKINKDKILNDADYCDDIRDALKTAKKVIVYPVLSLRVNGRIF